MGYARWNHEDWSDYAANTSRKTTEAVFASRSLAPELDRQGGAHHQSGWEAFIAEMAEITGVRPAWLGWGANREAVRPVAH